MIETYKVLDLNVTRNFNKMGEKFFYVIRRIGSYDWIGKILFDKKKDCWIIEFESEERLKELTELEKRSIHKIKNLISKDYK